jgi:hypothetical protein
MQNSFGMVKQALGAQDPCNKLKYLDTNRIHFKTFEYH